MTPRKLLEDLKEFIEAATAELYLKEKNRGGEAPNERPPKLFLMRVPTKKEMQEQAPYVLLQLITGSPNATSDNGTAKVRIVCVTYSEDESEGALSVLELITRIYTKILEQRQVGKYFAIENKLEYLIYSDDTAPYYIGELITEWETPTVRYNGILGKEYYD